MRRTINWLNFFSALASAWLLLLGISLSLAYAGLYNKATDIADGGLLAQNSLYISCRFGADMCTV